MTKGDTADEATSRQPWWQESTRALVWAWAISRVVVILATLAFADTSLVFGDLNLLWAAINGEEIQGEVPTIGEYPGALRLLAAPAMLAASPEQFVLGWLLVALCVDAALTASLARESRRAAWVWIGASTLLGPVTWARVEILLGLLCVAALRSRGRRPALAGTLLGLAALLKLWPLALAAALLPRRGWPMFSAALGGTVAIGVVAEVAVAGSRSVIDPWVWQVDRGIQIESLPATFALVAQRGRDPSDVIEFAFRSYQLIEPGRSWLDIAGLVFVLLIAGVAAALLLKVPEDSVEGTWRVAAALLATTVVAANSVFSPQYVLWFLPLVALASPVRDRPRGTLAVLSGLCVLTQAIFPWGYPPLVLGDDWALWLLASRNALVVALVLLLAIWLFRVSSRTASHHSQTMPPV